MFSKIAMIAMVLVGLRWLAADAPVSKRTTPVDRAPVAAERGDCDCNAGEAHAPHRATSRGDQAQLLSSANQERIKEVGGEVWGVARPVLVFAANKALEGLASMLHSAADRLPQAEEERHSRTRTR